MLLTHFIWQTDLKPLSGTNAKNGAITPSLTPTMQARCYNAGKWVRATWRGITNSSKHLGALLVCDNLSVFSSPGCVLVLVLHFCAVTVSSTGPRKLFKEMTTATSGVLARFPWLLPIRNPCELRGPCRHSYFGPRTCGGGENQCHRSWQGSQSGFPLLTLKCPLLCSVSSTKMLNTVHSWCG